MTKKNADIECLRAVAVILTMFQHLYVLFRWTQHPLGRVEDYMHFWGGVDLFLVISGFVVSKSFMNTLETARTHGREWYAVKAFWVRRLYRILPSAWFWLFVGTAGTFFFNVTGAFGTPHDAVLRCVAVMTGVANFAMYSGIDMGQTGVYWSLALEEQFYIAFPFFLLFVPIAWRYRVLLLAIAIQVPMWRSTGTVYWGTRLDALMWGVVLFGFSRAPQYQAFEPRSLANPVKAWCLSALLIFALAAIPQSLVTIRFHVALMALVSAVLVYMASFDRAYVLPAGIFRPLLLWIGSRSYAIYLCHLPAYMITHEFWTRWTKAHGLVPPDGTYTLRYAVMALALIAIFAELNYRLIETPLRTRGVTIARAISGAGAASPA